ncbi:ribosomal protein S5 domain 2-like protein [Mytilinidion resinicola]|uniref:Ribosomal RNA-processing protein 43 n=1 Tax=Mytilinidion resinicola TaxID=574789 RepID=A0A6A6YN93_9PEZI|nr:ribosomal protein S5 domain 2-like protein [Mytilinidion resinicola]KAF2810211.1 ribosomal protein S5 domain 2-like protein [Mytilinidion resinicola]
MAAASPSLSFPRDIFAALSPSPFLLAHLSHDSPSTNPSRPNGRAPFEFRKPTINTGSLSHCSGSAVVRLGDTAVVCGVRGEILLASNIPNPPTLPTNLDYDGDDDAENDAAELSNLSLLVPNIELATGASPAHLPGSPPSTLAQSLTSRIRALLYSTQLLRARDLRIIYSPPPSESSGDDESAKEVKAYWALYIDIMFISLDGNAFDVAWAAVVAALRDTLLPSAWWDEDVQNILCSPSVSNARSLKLRGLPMAATFAVFKPTELLSEGEQDEENAEEKAWVLSDPDAFEEGLCKEVVTVVVDGSGGKRRVRRIEKKGGGVVGREVMKGLVRRADERWREWSQMDGLKA